jgi:hypothetical protein
MAVYYVYSGAAGSNNGSSWANAFTTLTTAFATEAAGDTLYVAHDHAETTAAAITLTSSGLLANPTKVVCVNRSGSVPPVSADRRATATVSTTGASNITFNGYTHYDGVIFVAGNAANNANIILPNTAIHSLRFDNCSLRLGTTGTTQRIFIANGALGGTYVELNNTTVSFAHTGQSIDIAGMVSWRNTPSAVIGSAVPSFLFTLNSARGGYVECFGVDLSALGSGKAIVSATGGGSTANVFRFLDCKLDAAVTKSGAPASHGSTVIDFVRCGASGVNYNVFRQRLMGTLDQETTVVRVGGATDQTTPISWKVVTTANCHYTLPFECPPVAIWNDTTGSAVTATIECIGAALPNDDEVWLDLEYLGSGSSPQGSFVNDGKADLLVAAAAQTSSSETWGGSTAAFKLAVTFTPQQKGWVYARVKCAKASSTFYIDPLVTLT